MATLFKIQKGVSMFDGNRKKKKLCLAIPCSGKTAFRFLQISHCSDHSADQLQHDQLLPGKYSVVV